MKIIRLAKEEHQLPTYCVKCKKHLRGEDVGYDHATVSHGYCDKCLEEYMKEVDELV